MIYWVGSEAIETRMGKTQELNVLDPDEIGQDTQLNNQTTKKAPKEGNIQVKTTNELL